MFQEEVEKNRAIAEQELGRLLRSPLCTPWSGGLMVILLVRQLLWTLQMATGIASIHLVLCHPILLSIVRALITATVHMFSHIPYPCHNKAVISEGTGFTRIFPCCSRPAISSREAMCPNQGLMS